MSASKQASASVETLSGAQFEVRALLERHGLNEVDCAVAHFSFGDPESFVGAYDRDGELTPLIGFLPLPMNGAALLEAIASIDENASRLVANYRKAFPADAQRLAGFDANLEISETAALAWLFAACSLALGLDETDVARALESSLEVVTLDANVVRVDERYLLDSRYLLRSLMSYRIGDVPEYVLARSIFTSLGAFVTDSITKLLRDWHATVIVCTGDLFAGNVILRERAGEDLKHLGLPVLFPAGALVPAQEVLVKGSARSAGPQSVPVQLGTRGPHR